MRINLIASFLALTASSLAFPTQADNQSPAPPGGWDKVKYPAGTGENLDHYPAPPGGWDKVKYPAGTGEKLPYSQPPAPPVPLPSPCPGQNKLFKFTSQFTINASPSEVVNGTTPTGGLEGASAVYELGLNSDLDLICYLITLRGFRGEYQSPARTATHLHEAARGASGPPRIVFDNPTAGTGDVRTSQGCMTGPFTTGLKAANGADTGNGFTVRQIEDNPSAFMVDVHSSLAVPGAVRGQLASVMA